MKRFRAILLATVVLSATLIVPRPLFCQTADHLVISEVYGGGGNSGSLYKNDFVELYNPTDAPVVMAGWSLQYASSTAAFTASNRSAIGGTVPPHGFFLIQCAQGSGGTALLPAPDAVSAIAMSSSNGKIALVRDTLLIAGPADLTVVDFIGFGTAAQYEGPGAAPSPSNTASIERKARPASTGPDMASGGMDSLRGNGWDSDDNASDLLVRAFPNPQNSLAPAEAPPAGILAILSVGASPFVPARSSPDTVTAEITGTAILAVRLHVAVEGGAEDSSIVMTEASPGTWRGIVAGSTDAADGRLVEAYVSAADSAGQYVSSAGSPIGYFVGTSSPAAVKSRPPGDIAGYHARIAGVLNVSPNLFSAGLAYVQDSVAGIAIYAPAGIPSLNESRRITVTGSIAEFNGAYELTGPGFALVDTAQGSAALSPAVLALPLLESPSNVYEGRLVTVQNLSAPGPGTFAAGNYLFQTAGGDTITVRVESNGIANTLVGTALPSGPAAITGILSYGSGYLRLKPRKAEDAGNAPIATLEAVATGRWSDTLTWAGRRVPGPADNVSLSTLGVAVTVDIPDARCLNLTMTGSGSLASSGPVLKFDSTGAPSLTVNGALSISGGSGSGQGGRAKLTSNGNASAVLILRRLVSTTTANSTSSGSAGLNMNEGTVRLTGSSTDTLRNSAGFRMANLVIGDGISPKTVVWAPTKFATMAVRSIHVTGHSAFLIGDPADSNANDIGNASASGVPALSGGIRVDSGGMLIVQPFSGGNSTGSINLGGGGIVCNGTIILDTPATGGARSSYIVKFGGFGIAGGSTQSILGAGRFGPGDLVVGAGDTLVVDRAISLPASRSLTLNGRMRESRGHPVSGRIVAKRRVTQGQAETFGGIGCILTAHGAAPDTTTVTRITGMANLGNNGMASILRSFDISPIINAHLDAEMEFFWDPSELAGQDAEALVPWRSEDGGSSWFNPGLSWAVDTAARAVHIAGIQSLSRWTLSDSAHPLGSSTVTRSFAISKGWNLISLPILTTERSKYALFPGALSQAFSYSGSYIPAETLACGIGYWLKFPSDSAVALTGAIEMRDTIHVVEGWNLIGGISASIARSSIAEEPPGIVRSQFFGYGGGYVVSDTLRPFAGYWVKAGGAGTLILDAGAQPAAASGGAGKRYLDDSRVRQMETEFPPAPPEGAPDDGFTSDQAPENFALHGNYPNPCNPTTTMRYDLPVESNVVVEIYNALGVVVRRLMNRVEGAGFRSVVWDGKNDEGVNVSTGVYFYRLNATPAVGGGRTWSAVGKMVVVR